MKGIRCMSLIEFFEEKCLYRDFFLQYPPAYFYVLAGLFKLFGPSVLVGRTVSLMICLNVYLPKWR